MLEPSFRLQLGPYWLTLPEKAQLSVDLKRPTPGTHGVAQTHWVAVVGRFRLGIYLDAINDLSDLKRFIDNSTKSDVTIQPISINGLPGVMYGAYASPVTRFDWWFKKHDTMICLNLQGADFPFKDRPTETEIAEHDGILNSLSYCCDFPKHLPAGQ